MSYSSQVQCVVPPLPEKATNEGLTKPSYGAQPHLMPTTIPDKAIMSKKTDARGGKEVANVTSHLLEQVARRISRVHTPLIIAGSGILQKRTTASLVEFAARLEIPVSSTVAAMGSIPNTHPLWIGPINSPEIYSRYGFDWVDLVIAVGCDLVECAPEYWNPDGDIPILHISTSSATKNAYYHPTLELVGNLSYLLSDLSRRTNRQGKGVAYPLELRKLNQNTL